MNGEVALRHTCSTGLAHCQFDLYIGD